MIPESSIHRLFHVMQMYVEMVQSSLQFLDMYVSGMPRARMI